MADKFFLDVRNLDERNTRIVGLLDALNGEAELPCVLICAAYIDKCLEGILLSLFKSGNTSKRMLGHDGPLRSLYDRARILYVLGRIDSMVLGNIDTICQIRNRFAHSHEPLSFESPEIAKLCSLMQEPKPAMVVADDTWPKDLTLKMPRMQFTRVALLVVIELARLPLRLASDNH
jgi:DNA-binding MltR family transcriptional regulator